MIRKVTRIIEHPVVFPPKTMSQRACGYIGQINTSDKILVGATQGIGNAILTTPLIKALTSMNLKVDVFLPEGGLLNGAERIFAGMENVKVLGAEQVKERRYLLGLQTMWPYQGMENFVQQIRFAPNINRLWAEGILAHEVEVNMSLAYSLKYQEDIPSLYCAHNPFNIGIYSDKEKNIGIHICRKYNHQFHANRQMRNPLEVGRELQKRGHRVFIIGHEGAVTPKDMEENPDFMYYLGAPLEDVAGLIKELDCMINEDSGIMHVTAAMDTPQVALFGPTSDVKNSPWSEKAVVVKRDIQCVPCQYTERALNCFNNICLDIDTSYIVQLTESLL